MSYEIVGEVEGVWFCHCSNCRKASGSTGNAILVVKRENFFWLSGEQLRQTFELRPSYSITRCQRCGTPLPAEEDEDNIYLTAGTLDDPLDKGIQSHIFWSSRADWEHDMHDVRYFHERSTGARVDHDPSS